MGPHPAGRRHQSDDDHPRGGLDQGNIILNLQDLQARGTARNVLFLAGSAINTIKNPSGEADPQLGLKALLEAIEMHATGELNGVSPDEHLDALAAAARRHGFNALLESLRQRYPGKVA